MAVTDAQALAAFRELARLEGIIPALETAHALAWVLAQPDGELDLVCLSGRGDKDLAEVLARGAAHERRRDERRCSASPTRSRDTRQARGADALRDGRLPDARRVAADRRGVRATAGADVIELGVPYSDPLADGPVIHAAGTRALAAGANVAGVLEVARALSRERAGGR